MKTLDRYVAKNFIVGYIITTLVLIGLCTLVDLFVNLDEFAEHSQLGAKSVLLNIADYYMAQSTLWFRDLAGLITVVAAVFSLARMTYSNELIAIMASGVSLKRVITPIVLLSLVSMGLLIADQELVIPRLAHQLIRSHDYNPAGEEVRNVWFMTDENHSLICTQRFDGNTMYQPTFILRKPIPESPGIYEVVDIIQADEAAFDPERAGWSLKGGQYWIALENLDFYVTDLKPEQVPLKQQEGYKSLLSYSQLIALEKQEQRIKDRAELYLYKHARITDPIISVIMLMLALPVLVVRDPKTMKSAIMKCFGLVTLCFMVAFLCKMFATEEFFHRVRPELWTWAPIIIFFPIAFIELDAMKT
ncbi:MAG: LptF/LptG family permease [Sedimentisphaerales bacterium]|nr:LptF/LptG family permease [Sedimentisphaerales bacterium]